MEIFNFKIIQRCFEDAQGSEKFYLKCPSLWAGYYSTADFFYKENLKAQKKKFTFTLKKIN